MRFRLDAAGRFLFLAPAVLLLAVFSVYPLVRLIQFGLSSYSLQDIGAPPVFTGLGNLRRAAADEALRDSFLVTLRFVAVTVAIQFVAGFAVALAVDRGLRRSRMFRAFYIIPMMAPPIIVGTIWRLMYNPEFGIIDHLLRSLGSASPPLWLADPRNALRAVIAADVWQWVPFVFLLILAGLQSLPETPYEAAALDGAGPLQIFRYITLPLISQTIFLTLMFRTVMAFKMFDKMYILTSGGPGNATEIISLYMYKVAFSFGRIGYAAFIAVMTIAVMALLIVTFRSIIRRAAQ